MKLRWVRPALEDLREIDNYISADNPDAAKRALSRIRAHSRLLVDQPHLGRPGRVPGTRELIVSKTPFILPYRVMSDEIQILRVIHGARRWPKTFTP